MRLALYQPDIAQNTGTILRLAACLGVGVDVIAPAGFDMSDRALRRAGLDYLAHVEVARHASFADFEAARRRSGSRLLLLTTRAATAYTALPSSPPTHSSSAARAPASPTPSMRPPTPACASPCAPACAPSTSPSPPRWFWARRCGRRGQTRRVCLR